MNKPTDTTSKEYLLYCAARRLIRDIRNEPTERDRERRFAEITRKWSRGMQQKARDLVRALWKETNEEDGWRATTHNHNRGQSHGRIRTR